MKDYRISVITSQGRFITLRKCFYDTEDIHRFIKRNGYHLVSQKLINHKTKKKVPHEITKQFLEHLTFLLRSKFNLIEAIHLCMDTFPALKPALLTMHNHFAQGHTLYECCKLFPNLFDPITLQFIKTSPEEPAKTFEMILYYMNHRETLGQSMKRYLSYPLVLVIFIVFLFYIFSELIIPELTVAQDSYLVKTFYFFKIFLLPALGIFVLFWLLLSLMGRFFIKVRYFLDKMVFYIPVFGDLYKQFLDGIYYKILALMVRAKIPLPHALSSLCSAINNLYIKKQYENLLYSIEDGGIDIKEFMEDTLERKAVACLKQVQDRTEKILKIIEPTSMVITGLLILWIISTIWLPLYDEFF